MAVFHAASCHIDDFLYIDRKKLICCKGELSYCTIDFAAVAIETGIRLCPEILRSGISRAGFFLGDEVLASCGLECFATSSHAMTLYLGQLDHDEYLHSHIRYS